MAGERRRRLGALGLATLAVLAACSSGGGADSERSDDAPTTQAPADGGTDGPTPTDGGAAAPGALRLGFAGVTSLDPASASPASVSAMALADLLHDGLTVLDAVGAPQPALADFVPGEDLTTWRFTLREGVTFADGSPVEADDVVFTIERIRAQGGSSLAAIQLEDVQGVAAVDPRTVELTLRAPSALLPEVLSSPLYGIVDRYLPPAGPDAPLNPSGPYRVATAPQRLALERRAGAGPAAVEARLFPDDAAAHDAFAAGELDWAPVPLDHLGTLDEASLAWAPFHATVLLGVNPSVEPLTRPALRHAVGLAIDRAAVTAAVFGSTARPAHGLIPAGVAGASESCRGPCGADVERARQLVAEAFPEGTPPPPLRLLTDETSTHEAIATLVVQQLGEIGLDVTAQALDEGTYAAQVAAGQAPLYLHSALGTSRMPATHLLPWASDSPDNTTRYANPLVDLAIAAAVSEPDRAVRIARWQEIEAAVLADVPVVPLAQLRTIVAVTGRAKGMVVHADGSIDLSAVAPA
ncbi:MAG TPA: ABC transporter substrate-binding protein [Acidimicrobiales bacterium]|nr:ABC transporter substrate-binding protein [Acidimicrobiales bacterium]